MSNGSKADKSLKILWFICLIVCRLFCSLIFQLFVFPFFSLAYINNTIEQSFSGGAEKLNLCEEKFTQHKKSEYICADMYNILNPDN